MATDPFNGTINNAPIFAEGTQTDVPNTMDSDITRVEPLISVDELRDIYLFGIPLVSWMPNPITGKRDVMSDNIVKRFIDNAVFLAESELKIVIMPTTRLERKPFDRNEYQSMGYFQLDSKPVLSVEYLNIEAPSRLVLYTVPNEWIEPGFFTWGQINIIPLNVASVGAYSPQGTPAAGTAFLAILGQQAYVPGFWMIKYQAGFADGMIPRTINQFIATVASIEILRQLSATNARNTSHSIGIDGLSQSVSTPGPQLYLQLIEDLEKKRAELKGKITNMFGTGWFSGTL